MKKLYKQKELVIKMRLRGMSYSQIKTNVKVSKSTLSLWLKKYPLSIERIRELRDWNPRRIESSRNTKLRKRNEKMEVVFKQVSEKIGVLSKREIYIAGMFLYWGEGTKSARDMVILTNTDPSVIKYFISWLELFGIKRDMLKVKLHLYLDMDIKKEINYWSKALKIKEVNFRKPYIKNSKLSQIEYKNSFTHGTCSVIYGNSNLHNEIMMSLRYLREVVLLG